MTADPLKTYALVVGVEQYAAGPKWDLDGPANDAKKFVEWLRGRRVPEENIFLYLSPLDKNRVMDGLKAPEAIHENIYQALTTSLPSKREGTLLYLFWGGHGMITTDNQRLLCYADATQQNILNLDLNSLLTSLRSDYFSGFDQQIFFIDACANYVVHSRLHNTLPHETFSSGNPLTIREQFICLASKPGEYAKNVTQQRTGLFSWIVREELAKQGIDHWPPDMESLITSLSLRFSELRAEGEAKQVPTHFWYKNWNGSERFLSDVPVTTVRVNSVAARLEPSQRRALTDLLYVCDTVARKETREGMIRDLRYVIKVNLLRDRQNDRFDIRGIIDTCLNYAGGLHEWIENVRYYEQDSLPMQQVDAFMEQVPPEL